MEQLQRNRPAGGPARARGGLSDGGKIAACWLAACLLAVGYLTAADITGGYTFTSGEKNVTHTKLNSLGAGTINTTFYTDKSSQTAVTGDTLLYYASADAGFRRTTVGTLFGNAPAINGLSTINSTGNFSVNTSKFTVSATDGAVAWLGPATVSSNVVISLTKEGAALAITNGSSSGSARTLVLHGQGGGATALDVVSGGMSVAGATSISGNLTLAAGFTTTAAGQLVASNTTALYGNMTFGDAAGDTITVNGTLAGTVQGTPTVTLTAKGTPTTSDSVLISDAAASNVLKSATVSSLGAAIFSRATAQSYIPNSGATVTLAHNLGGIPQSFRTVLVCTNLDGATGYAAGDEIDAAFPVSGNYREMFQPRIDGTNAVFARGADNDGNFYLIPKTGGTAVGITDRTNFNLKIYAVRFP